MEAIRSLIKKHKKLKESNRRYSEKLINEFDVFKRYTSSKKDHGPQSRLVYNMRRAWPITIVNSSKMPNKLGKWPLKEGKQDIDDRTKTRATIHAVDYWATFGEECADEVSRAMISMQLNMVKEFFSLELDDLEFSHNFIIRKPVVVSAPIEDVKMSNVNNTLMGLFAPEVLGSRRTEQIDRRVIDKLKLNLGPVIEFRSTPSVVHLARSWITPKVKWLPTSIYTDSSTSEIIHVINSRYHRVNVSTLATSDDNAMERLCGDLVIKAKEASNPKERILEYLSSTTLHGISLSIILIDYNNEKPYTNICRACCGYSIATATIIRETRFTIIDSEGPRVSSRTLWKFGMHSDLSEYTHFKGKAKVFFERMGTNGFFEVENKTVKVVYIQAKPGDSVKNLLYDILYYCASIEPGFDKPFNLYTRPSDRIKNFFIEHEQLPLAFYKEYGISKQGVVSNDLHFKVDSRGYLEKVKEIDQPIQPYDQTKHDTFCDAFLNVIKKSPLQDEVVINSDNIKRNDWPLPLGLKVTHPELNGIIVNPLKKFQLIAEMFLNRGEMLERSVLSTVNETADPSNKAISNILEPGSGQRAAKRKLEAVLNNDERWNENPVKRYKAFYYNLVANSPETKGPSTSFSGIPPFVKLRGISDTIQQSRKRGLVTGDDKHIVVLNKKIRLDNEYTAGYAQVGVYSTPQKLITVETIEEATNKGLNKFQILSKSRYFVFEKKEYSWSESDNINKVNRAQMAEVNMQQVELSIQDVLGIN
nr:PB2 [Orthomyxoviridae sp.]